MYKLNVEGTEYNVKFAYLPTLKERIISKVVGMSDVRRESGEDVDLSKVEDLLLFVPEVLLVGLQTYHKDEFGYNYNTGEGKEEALEKVYDIMDEYTAENDILDLFIDLQEELRTDSFFKTLFRRAEQGEELTAEETAQGLIVTKGKKN